MLQPNYTNDKNLRIMFVRDLFWFVIVLRDMEELPSASLPNLTIGNGSCEASEVWVVSEFANLSTSSHCT